MVPRRWVSVFSMVILISFPAVFAAFLAVHKSDGSVERIDIETIKKITFDLNGSSESKQINLPKLKAIASAIKTNTLFADITYTLKKSGRVSVAAFTLSGKKIKTIRNGIEPVGLHTCRWDYTSDAGTKVPNGTYIIHVERDGEPWSQCLFIVQ